MLMIDIVLYEPEIPPNTGNIGRLCASNQLCLHLVEPLGFKISNSYLKRAGLDYWNFLDFKIHPSWSDLKKHLGEERNYWFFTTKATKSYWSTKFMRKDVLVFGPETRGLPKSLIEANFQNALLIPMFAKQKRSLNLSTSVGIATYEALRQIKLRENFL